MIRENKANTGYRFTRTCSWTRQIRSTMKGDISMTRGVQDAFKANARFAANYTINICSISGFIWVRIYVTRKIYTGEEILIDYGDDFWKFISLQELITSETSAPTTNSPAKRDGTSSSSLWAASAPMPDSTPELTPTKFINHQNSGSKEVATPAPQQTDLWPNQVFAPANPAMLGHRNTKHPPIETPSPIHFPPSLSPIKQHNTSPNTNSYMNEIYSFTQLHDPDNTLLLPITITNT